MLLLLRNYINMSKLEAGDFLGLFKSQELWKVPIESFIDEYCLIFTPSEFESQVDIDQQAITERREDIGERKKIFDDYKKLINEILADTLMKKAKNTTFAHLLKCLSEHFQEDWFLSDPNVFNSLKYLLAVEDFSVFTVFMEDKNILLNDQTIEVEKSIIQSAPQTARSAEMKLAIEASLAEEEERKRRIKEIEEAEDEALRMALEASLRLQQEMERPLEQSVLQDNSFHNSVAEQDQQPALSNRQLQQSDFRISKKKKQVPVLKTQMVSAQEELKQEKQQQPSVESLEERRQRLRATRDALAKSKLDNTLPLEESKKDTRTKQDQDRLQRCLKVLREAADEVFKQPSSSLNNSSILDTSTDGSSISSKFRKARMLNQQIGDQSSIIEKSMKVEEIE